MWIVSLANVNLAFMQELPQVLSHKHVACLAKSR